MNLIGCVEIETCQNPAYSLSKSGFKLTFYQVTAGYNRYSVDKFLFKKNSLFEIFSYSSAQIAIGPSNISDYIFDPFQKIDYNTNKRFLFRPLYNCTLNKTTNFTWKYKSTGSYQIRIEIGTTALFETIQVTSK